MYCDSSLVDPSVGTEGFVQNGYFCYCLHFDLKKIFFPGVFGIWLLYMCHTVPWTLCFVIVWAGLLATVDCWPKRNELITLYTGYSSRQSWEAVPKRCGSSQPKLPPWDKKQLQDVGKMDTFVFSSIMFDPDPFHFHINPRLIPYWFQIDPRLIQDPSQIDL